MISVSGVCSTDFKCTITVAGSIQSLLVDGDKYTASSSISAWCDKGRCYGSADIPLTATAPFTITCDQVTGTHACSATISGAANAIFTNGQQVGKFSRICHSPRTALTCLRTLGMAHTCWILQGWCLCCFHQRYRRPNVLDTYHRV